MSKIFRFVTNDLTVRVASVNTTEVVAEMQSLQSSYPLATLAVGRAMTGAVLMASQLKEGQQVGLHFKGNGPLGSVFAEANFEGHTRGYCPEPQYQAPHSADATKVGKALGFGTLSVTRHLPFQRLPVHGTVEIQTGEIGEDIAHYLLQSHQLRCLINLGVYLDAYGRVQSAGGVLIEVMPGVEQDIVNKLEENALKYPRNISKLILDGASPYDLVVPYMEGLPFTEIPHPHEARYFCPCTVDRVMRALGTLGQTDLQEMIDEGKNTKIQCQMCGRSYEVTPPELAELKETLRRNSMH